MQSVCPECEKLNAVENLYCDHCGAQMTGATLVKSGPPGIRAAGPDSKSGGRRWWLIAVVAIAGLSAIGILLLLALSQTPDEESPVAASTTEQPTIAPTATPDVNQEATAFAGAVITQVAVEKAAAAVLTAEAPTTTATHTQTHTAAPTNTATVTNTPVPTNTATATPSPTNTPTQTSTATPTVVPWKHFTAEDLNLELDYPSDCESIETGAGRQFLCPDKWNAMVGAFDRTGDYKAFWEMSLEETGSRMASALAEDYGLSLADFLLAYSEQIENYGAAAHLVRYQAPNGLVPIEVLIVRSPLRLWTFMFFALGQEHEEWTKTTIDSISLVIPPTPTPKPTAKPKLQPTKAPTSTPAPVDFSKFPHIGDSVQAGGWTVKVLEVQKRKAVYFYGSPYVAHGHFLTLEMEVTNNQSGTSYFATQEPWLVDRPGDVYRESSKAGRYAAWMRGGRDSIWTDVNPGVTRRLAVAFDLPDSVRDVLLSMKPGVWIYLGDFEAMQSED